MLLIQGSIRRFALIQDLQSGAIGNGVQELVFVDVLAEALDRPLLSVAVCDQRCTGKGDPGCIGECLKEIVREAGTAFISLLRPMCLVDHQQNA